MANITIVKLKVRRGTDDQRKTIVLDQGEVGYTLDTKRLFVGDGAKLGGNVIGNNGLGTFTSLQSLGDVVGGEVGDIGYANSSLFMLSSIPYEWNSSKTYLSGFAYIGTKAEDSTASIIFDSDGRVTVKKDSLDAAFFKSEFFGDGVTHIPTQKGDIIAFSSFIPHRVTNIVSGERWAIVAWFSGPQFR